LEEVSDEIRSNLARPIATERRQKLLGDIIAAVSNYSREFGKWKIHVAREEELKKSKTASKVELKPAVKPAPLDLSKVLEGTSLTVEETPLVDQHEIQAEVDGTDDEGKTKKVPKYEIARASFLDFSSGRFQNLSFAEIAYADKENFYSAQTLPFP